MYLTNRELKKLRHNIIVDCPNSSHPFDDEKQIKVCSYDIRVGNIFWKMRKQRHPVNLGSKLIFEISPTRIWGKKPIIVEDGGCIELKPGEMILGQTYEKISIPNHLVGKITVRSSYARLGLWTACNCDLINPGYVGHVPLELINTSPNKLLIYPYLPLCQIFIMELNGDIDSSYNSAKYNSKYQDDEGGPSYWWRDELVEKISTTCLTNIISDSTLHKLIGKFKNIDDKCLYRLEQFISNNKFNNSNELLQSFSSKEIKKERWHSTRRNLSLWAFPSLLLVLLGAYFTSLKVNDAVLILLVIVIALLIPFLYYSFTNKISYYHYEE